MTTMTGPTPTPTNWQTLDRIAAVLLLCLEMMLGMAALGMSGLFVMATDSCGSGTPCETGYVFAGMVLAWAGIGLGAGGSMVMVAVNWSKGRAVWFWPIVGTGIIVAAFIGGAGLASQVM